jgi:hypothetical protein
MGNRFITITCLLAAFNGWAQISQRSEVGGGLGGWSYSGDIVRNYNVLTSKPAVTVFYRRNLNKVASFKAGFTYGKLGARDARKPIDQFAVRRDQSFNLNMMEFSGTYEYHFVDWRDDKRRLRVTPYLFGGLGLFVFSGNATKAAQYSNAQFSIPFGGGVKYLLNPKWYMAVEFGIRKTFFDYLDNVSGSDPSQRTFNQGNSFDKDNYFWTGITLSRTFYDIPCPTSPYRKPFRGN